MYAWNERITRRRNGKKKEHTPRTNRDVCRKFLKRKERPRPVGRSRSGARLADKSIDLEAYSQQIAEGQPTRESHLSDSRKVGSRHCQRPNGRLTLPVEDGARVHRRFVGGILT
ncbi:unnamed protein product [Clavelina lepadiformis]|uniref:Uncharacterized protein n=1 Tax=Clavelina lepadiformis TaxID=159417 RepID=A0ABP0GTX9_CLALP